ncbi:MAG: thymidine phosphorylase [Rubrivivax sp.]|nr:thymidine phosphorylase [Rubrivivax sp.]
MPLAQELIRIKRDGGELTSAQIGAFVQGLTQGTWSEGQVAAMAMAIVLRGMNTAETVALTEAMTRSGTVLDWRGAALPGPVLDKHSTGGVGDKVSLVLAPVVAACGGVVPMISGRGLGHTGGTLDKLEALPGYTVEPAHATLLATLHTAGCAIVGASADLAPADRRLYAIRDTTATVESVPLITASILSKKRAAGLQALVMDVKVGRGAFLPTLAQARELAASLVRTARGAGLPTVALITDMNRVLGRTAGNALEVQEALALLRGDADAVADAELTRLRELTLALAAELLHLGGLHADTTTAHAAATQALTSGAAAERFARMVAGLGGPRDVLRNPGLPRAPVQRAVPAPRAGFVGAIDVRALGLAVVALGGGRRRPGDTVDPRVGLAAVLAPGAAVQAGDALAWVHAARAADAEDALRAVTAALPVGDHPPPTDPLLLTRVDG